ncbi:MAG: sugar-binding transcriptional regulator [Stappiaceae bacterium]
MKSSQRLNHPSDKLVAEIAWLYYIKGLTQGDVAKQKSLSRPTVISYLKLARDRGIVNIKLAPEHLRLNDLTDSLKERFTLENVHVVPDIEGSARDQTIAVGEVAAHLLPDFLEPGDQLGVSWGETISHVADTTPHWPIKDLTVRQLIGSMANPLMITAESCTTEIARRMSAFCVNMNAPAVCSNIELANALREEPIINEQLASLKQCNKAIFSLSPCVPDTHVVHFKVATKPEIRTYQKQGAVCILVGRFLDAEGNIVSGELDDRLFSVKLSDLKKMTGFLVVSGRHKSQATLAALRGGYVQHLVLNTSLAEDILKSS